MSLSFTISRRMTLLFFALLLAFKVNHGAPPPTPLEGLSYTNAYFPNATYDPAIPTQERLLGFAAGARAATHAEIERCLRAWTDNSPRARLVEYARSHENRTLYYVILTSPAHHSRLDEIRSGIARLGDPRQLSEEEAEVLMKDLPGVAWLACTIHGDETEGSDAALALLYHLTAAQGGEVEKLLEDLVIIIDPLMNPDGRDRFLKMIAENRGTAPNVDDRSLTHTGYYPRGRGNHYWFDLNRDWILGVHPETRGRIREVGRWNPLLFVDAHGMGAQDTHLFSPPRPPVNPHIPRSRMKWGERFAQDQARAFDRQGWLYYSGEWHEEWYPGYSDAWSSYRGAVGILYEQARIAEDGVRRPGGRILTYRESVHHHVAGFMANLRTLQQHRPELFRDFFNNRKQAVDKEGPYAKRTFAILPTPNESRLNDFLELMLLEGFEVYQAEKEFTVPLAADQLGREQRDAIVPAGTLLIPNRQPLAHLLAAMLEFDPHLPEPVLKEEREELLRLGQTRIYDTTAWNLTMMHGLKALTLPVDLPSGAVRLEAPPQTQGGLAQQAEETVACVIDGADDASITAAARLMEREVAVRVAEKAFLLDGRDFSRGSVVINALDNRHTKVDWKSAVHDVSQSLKLEAHSLKTGLGAGDLPDLGGRLFTRLEPPRIALLGRGGYSVYDYGEIWHTLDQVLGIRHSRLDGDIPADLSRYNVVIVPDRWFGQLDAGWIARLKDWVENSGTLIAVGRSAGELAKETGGLGRVRLLPDVLEKIADYELAMLRQWMARQVQLPSQADLWSHQARGPAQYPWQLAGSSGPDAKELKKRDDWNQLFMPQGSLLAGRLDLKHWLTFGCEEPLPLLIDSGPVLMAGENVEAPIRMGLLSPSAPKKSASAEPEEKEAKESNRIGWAALPAGTEMYLRMSGLLWPEAAQRLANAPWVTRESIGRGQVILFASSPAFRASTRGPRRVLLNAMIYGPGFGAAQPVRP